MELVNKKGTTVSVKQTLPRHIDFSAAQLMSNYMSRNESASARRSSEPLTSDRLHV